jgi:DNA-binding response OmpR family regulator
MNVLIVEDDDSVARFLKQAMTEAGYGPQVVGDGLDALALARTTEFDLILLDVMIPRMDGFEVCRRLRSAKVMTPILIITARDALEDKVEGLDSGADDYIVKPFEVAELLARARALLRRGVSSPTVLQVADLSLDPATRHASRGGKTIRLSATEYSLLEYLMRNAGRVVTRSMILEHVWQYDFGGNDNVLDVYISYLRSKIDKGHSPALIHTVRGVGYRLDAADA